MLQNSWHCPFKNQSPCFRGFQSLIFVQNSEPGQLGETFLFFYGEIDIYEYILYSIVHILYPLHIHRHCQATITYILLRILNFKLKVSSKPGFRSKLQTSFCQNLKADQSSAVCYAIAHSSFYFGYPVSARKREKSASAHVCLRLCFRLDSWGA